MRRGLSQLDLLLHEDDARDVRRHHRGAIRTRSVGTFCRRLRGRLGYVWQRAEQLGRAHAEASICVGLALTCRAMVPMSDERAQARRGSRLLIAFLLIVPLVIGVAVALFVRLVPRTSCHNEVLAEEHASGAEQRAVVFRRNCGPAAPLTTNVSVVAASDALPDDVGNVLILKDVHDVAVRWTDATHLAVGYPKEAADALEAGAVHGIEVTLEP